MYPNSIDFGLKVVPTWVIGALQGAKVHTLRVRGPLGYLRLRITFIVQDGYSGTQSRTSFITSSNKAYG